MVFVGHPHAVVLCVGHLIVVIVIAAGGVLALISARQSGAAVSPVGHAVAVGVTLAEGLTGGLGICGGLLSGGSAQMQPSR